jgi:nondiscriminating glutamyl-tRNA synthetase
VSEVTEHVGLFFAEKVDPADDEARAALAGDHVPAVLNLLAEKLRAAGSVDEDTARGLLKVLGKELGLPGKKVFMPLRVAITGRIHGPELHQVIAVLGAERTINRLERALL